MSLLNCQLALELFNKSLRTPTNHSREVRELIKEVKRGVDKI